MTNEAFADVDFISNREYCGVRPIRGSKSKGLELVEELNIEQQSKDPTSSQIGSVVFDLTLVFSSLPPQRTLM